MANVKLAMEYAAAIDRAAREERMSNMTTDGECGYDRTASLNAGHYVCLCGGTCSHYDAKEQP